ncbi:MAG: T9SS type A sorting domain-containing protein [Bacteroidales bacterium]|nr:T9SS type A sorting domain-containing protein [Bacteroidales bacterium]
MTFEGEDMNTSVLFGTTVKASLNSDGLDKKYTCVAYSSFYGYNNGDSYIKNLTCLNPLGFMFTGKGHRLHLDKVRGIDNRGGIHNHSDGISAAGGSTVKNCYLETGDDAIKVYADILVEDTEIVMAQNCIPIQYTWGKNGNGAKGTFKNVKITGTKGRGTIRAVFNLASRDCGDNYSKTIVMDGCIIDNPNATLFHMKDNNVESNVTITNSKIKVKTYGGNYGTGTINICGSTAQSKTFDCYDNSSLVDENTANLENNVFPNPFTDILQIESDFPIYYLADMSGRVILKPSSKQGLHLYTFNTQNLQNGVYMLVGQQSVTKVLKNK